MSRAGAILQWVQTVDEGDPSSWTVDHEPQFHLTAGQGYTYMNRGQKDRQGDTRMADGTKPSGMEIGGGGGGSDPSMMMRGMQQ